MKKILVTGGSGFIGTNLIQKLIKKIIKFIILTNYQKFQLQKNLKKIKKIIHFIKLIFYKSIK